MSSYSRMDLTRVIVGSKFLLPCGISARRGGTSLRLRRTLSGAAQAFMQVAAGGVTSPESHSVVSGGGALGRVGRPVKRRLLGLKGVR